MPSNTYAPDCNLTEKLMANLKTAVTETVEAETMYLHTPLIRQEKQPQASILAAFEAIWKGFH